MINYVFTGGAWTAESSTDHVVPGRGELYLHARADRAFVPVPCRANRSTNLSVWSQPLKTDTRHTDVGRSRALSALASPDTPKHVA